MDSKIRINLECFNHELLDLACAKIMQIIQKTSVTVFGIISLPTKKRIYCVLRSPHVDKDSREHFEIRNHKRIIEIYYDSKNNGNVNSLVAEANLPAGVFFKITLSSINK